MVFDAPKIKAPFKKRIKRLEDIVKKINSPFLKCLEHFQKQVIGKMIDQSPEVFFFLGVNE